MMRNSLQHLLGIQSLSVQVPVLVRPSFVLSGAAMRVAINETQLSNFLGLAAKVSADKPVVVTKFILNAKEIEFDAVANALWKAAHYMSFFSRDLLSNALWKAEILPMFSFRGVINSYHSHRIPYILVTSPIHVAS
mmetsp:Transcript_2562/g.3909  ORF Transcript_2562/g.3909 Transcript_2562/m.3909 type:complete len:136 (-) Transcript_2562:11-418(-)